MVIQIAATAIMFLAGAWIFWRIAPVVAEAIIATPRINTESIDAHLIRICTRLLGIVAAAGLLAVGASRLGLPVYGIIAGLGVGGLAIALAAQPTVENLIGGFSLFADKPIRVGDFCRCGSDEGTVEAIGIRSTRIRGGDRTLTTIPNGGALEDVDREPGPARPDADQIGHRRSLRDQPGATALSARQASGGASDVIRAFTPISSVCGSSVSGRPRWTLKCLPMRKPRNGRNFSASGKTYCCGSWTS